MNFIENHTKSLWVQFWFNTNPCARNVKLFVELTLEKRHASKKEGSS